MAIFEITVASVPLLVTVTGMVSSLADLNRAENDSRDAVLSDHLRRTARDYKKTGDWIPGRSPVRSNVSVPMNNWPFCGPGSVGEKVMVNVKLSFLFRIFGKTGKTAELKIRPSQVDGADGGGRASGVLNANHAAGYSTNIGIGKRSPCRWVSRRSTCRS